jgi:hypothetical protein
MRRHWKVIVPGLVLGATMVGIAPTPVAQAQFCGLRHSDGSTRPDKNAALIANGVTCEQASAVFNDWFGGKGTQTARNAATVDGYDCVGNPGGVYSQTGVLSYCDGNGAHFELRDP